MAIFKTTQLFVMVCGIILTSLLENSIEFGNATPCQFPGKWTGQWMKIYSDSIEHHEIIRITNTTIQGYANDWCLSMEEYGSTTFNDSFKLIVKYDDECYKCLLIIPVHKNVLKYKESAICQDLPELATCLHPDDTYTYLYRKDAEPVTCLINGSYTFSYTKNGAAECEQPISHLRSCTTPAKILFDFQSCPNVPGTESVAKEFTCLGSWEEENGFIYVVGKMLNKKPHEEVFRCLGYRKDFIGSDLGIRMSMSETASCLGVDHEAGGHQTLHFRFSTQAPYCHFPQWLTSTRKWHSLDRTHYAKVDSKMILEMVGLSQGKEINYLLICNGPDTNSTQTENFSALAVTKIANCDRSSICLHFYKRSALVTEVQMFDLPANNDDDGEQCGNNHASLSYIQTLTLVSSDTDDSHGQLDNFVQCPFIGKYSVSKLKKHGELVWNEKCRNGIFNTLVIEENSHTMRFYSNCESQPVLEFNCLASWEENESTFVVIQSVSTNEQNTIASNEVLDTRNHCLHMTTSSHGLLITSNANYCKKSYKESSEDEWSFIANLLSESSTEKLEISSSSSNLLWIDFREFYMPIMQIYLMMVYYFFS